MERSGFGGLVVVDNARHLLDYLELSDVTVQRDQTVIDHASYRPLPSSSVDAKLADLIQRVHAEGSPLIILDARERVVGVVDKSTLLAALAQGDAGPGIAATTALPADAAPQATENAAPHVESAA